MRLPEVAARYEIYVDKQRYDKDDDDRIGPGSIFPGHFYTARLVFHHLTSTHYAIDYRVKVINISPSKTYRVKTLAERDILKVNPDG